MTGVGEAAGRAERVWLAMNALVLEVDDRRRRVAEELGVSWARARALRRLAGGGLSLRDLAAQLRTDAPYASLVVDDLERQGLVERRTDPADRRRKIATCTEAGLRAARRAEEILREPPPALAALPNADLADLDRILAAVLGAAS